MSILIERFAHERLEFAHERLKALVQAEGLVAKAPPEVPFVCAHNGRRQMAAALAHELSGGQVRGRSAGSHPTERIDPVVVNAMSEIRIDVPMEFPRPLTDEVVRADGIVTLGCGDASTVYPGKRYEDWDAADLGRQPLETVAADPPSTATSPSCSKSRTSQWSSSS
jgi:protein-tyrosine-phosphatase